MAGDDLTLKLVMRATDGMSDVVKKACSSANQNFNKLKGQLNNLAQGFEDFGKKTAVAGGVLMGASGITAKMAGDFEERMNNVSTLIDTNVESLSEMSAKVLDIGKNSPKAIGDLAEGLYNIRSAGISADEQFNVLKGSEMLAVAGLATTAEAVDVTTSALNTFQLKGEEASKMYDMFFKVVKYGKTNVSEFAQGFGAVAGVVASADIKLDEYSAAVAAMTTVGVKANIAHTQMKAVIAGLSRATDDQVEVFNKLGAKSFKDLIAKSGGMVNALEKIKTAVHGDEATIISLMGSVEAYNAVMSLTGATNEAYLSTLNDMRFGSNALEEGYQKQMSGFNNQMRMLKNNFETIGIKLGTSLFPILNKGMDIVKDVLAFIEKLPPGVTNAASLITAGAGAGLLALSGLSFAVGGAIKGFAGLMDFAGKAGGAISSVSGKIGGMTPITFDLRHSLTGIKNGFKNIIPAAVQGTKNVGLFIKNCSISVLNGFKGALNAVKNGFINFIPNVKKGIAALRTFNITMALNPIGLISAGIIAGAFIIMKFWNPIKAFFRGFFAGLKEGLKPLKPAFDGIAKAVKPIVDWVKKLFTPINTAGEASENFGKKIGLAIGGAVTWCAKLISKFKDIITLGGRIKFGGKKDEGVIPDGSHALGLSRVPFDGYLAETHKDEAILTAPEAEAWRNYKTQNTKNQQITINYSPQITGVSGDDKAKIMSVLKEQASELLQIFEKTLKRREVRSYG